MSFHKSVKSKITKNYSEEWTKNKKGNSEKCKYDCLPKKFKKENKKIKQQ